MYLLGRSISSLLQTHLTKWVSRRIVITDTFPRYAVTLAGAVLSAVAFVLLVGKFGMLGAVTVMRKFRTIRVSTRVCRFGRHKIISNRKSPAFSEALHNIFYYTVYHTRCGANNGKPCHFSGTAKFLSAFLCQRITVLRSAKSRSAMRSQVIPSMYLY